MLKMLRNENLYERFRIKVVGIVDDKKNVTLSYLKNQVKNFEELTKDIHKASAKLLQLKRNKYGKNWILRERRSKKGFLPPYPNLQLIKGSFLEIIDLASGKFVLLENGLVIHKDRLAHHLKIREEFVEEFPEGNLAVITKEEIPFFKEGVIQTSKNNNIEIDDSDFIYDTIPTLGWVFKHLPIPIGIQVLFGYFIFINLEPHQQTSQFIWFAMFLPFSMSIIALNIQAIFGYQTLRKHILWYYIAIFFGILVFAYIFVFSPVMINQRVDVLATSLGGVLSSAIPTLVIGIFFRYKKYKRENRNFFGEKRKTNS